MKLEMHPKEQRMVTQKQTCRYTPEPPVHCISPVDVFLEKRKYSHFTGQALPVQSPMRYLNLIRLFFLRFHKPARSVSAFPPSPVKRGPFFAFCPFWLWCLEAA